MSHDQFIKERQYLSNVSPATIESYTQSLHWLGSESPSSGDLKDFVLRMRAKGLKATACNNRIRAVNAYLKWAGLPLRVPKLKEPDLILPTFTLDQVHRLTRYRPKTFCQKRLHMIVLTLLDTGCRISEALGLRIEDCDLDNLLLTVTGSLSGRSFASSIACFVPTTCVFVEDPHLWAKPDRFVATDASSSARRRLSEGAEAGRSWGCTDKSLELAEKDFDSSHPSSLQCWQPGCEAVDVPITWIVAPLLRTFHRIPCRPNSGSTQIVRFVVTQRKQTMMPSALLIRILGTNSIDQLIDPGLMPV